MSFNELGFAKDDAGQSFILQTQIKMRKIC